MLYPRLHTIEIPYNVKAQYRGLYASFKASEFLMKESIGAMNQRSVSLFPHPVDMDLYVLKYESSAPIKLPSDEELYAPIAKLEPHTIPDYLSLGQQYGVAQGETQHELEKEVLQPRGLSQDSIKSTPDASGITHRPSKVNKSTAKTK